MVLPAVIAAALIASAAAGGMSVYQANQAKKGRKKSSRDRAKETRRETFADMLDQANSRDAEITGMGLQSHARLGKRKAQSMMDTAANMREALNI